MPSGTVRVEYRVGGGRIGNVEPNTLVVLDGGLSDVRGTPVRARVRNPARAEGGTERESIDEIRDRAPQLTLDQMRASGVMVQLIPSRGELHRTLERTGGDVHKVALVYSRDKRQVLRWLKRHDLKAADYKKP